MRNGRRGPHAELAEARRKKKNLPRRGIRSYTEDTEDEEEQKVFSSLLLRVLRVLLLNSVVNSS